MDDQAGKGLAGPRAVIIGRPIKHARSPLIHGYWLAENQIDGSYDRREVMPGAVAATLRDLRDEGYLGGNVTVPHKEEAFAACDHLTERARIAGAVNTFWFDGPDLCGDNTDGIGFVGHLSETWPDWDKNPAEIRLIGAGGAARGLIAPLLDRNVKTISVTNRSRERAESLCSDLKTVFPHAQLSVLDWRDRGLGLGTVDLLVNTTSLGMAGQPSLDLDLTPMKPTAIVADIVYIPLETPLLAQAGRMRLRRLDGLGMLLHQAVPGFERWFGVRPRVTAELRQQVFADLLGQG
ncbi:MAG: shikimate dehydrogenase [Beijerinckiaceae bacterium]|jgi:shikimate dehydrogenase|nr:shikimate dehydrogenase [Beijerinckiaceae bacterium]